MTDEVLNNLQRVERSQSTVRKRLGEQHRGQVAKCKPPGGNKKTESQIGICKNVHRRTTTVPEQFYRLRTQRLTVIKVIKKKKSKVRRKKGSVHDPEHAPAHVRSIEVGSRVFPETSSVISVGRSRMKYRDILSASLRKNASELMGRKFITLQDNDPKHTDASTMALSRGKQWKGLDRPSQSPDLNSIKRHSFHLLNTRLKGENPAKQTAAKRKCICCFNTLAHLAGLISNL